MTNLNVATREVNSKGVGLLSVVGKLYDRLLIKKLGPELNAQQGRNNEGFGRLEDPWTKKAGL